MRSLTEWLYNVALSSKRTRGVVVQGLGPDSGVKPENLASAVQRFLDEERRVSPPLWLEELKEQQHVVMASIAAYHGFAILCVEPYDGSKLTFVILDTSLRRRFTIQARYAWEAIESYLSMRADQLDTMSRSFGTLENA